MDMKAYTFDVEADRKLDQELAGNRFNTSETGDQDLGMTSDTPDQNELANKALRERAIENAKEELGQPDAVSRLKKIIGDQGNEIGQLRQTAAQAEQLRQRLDQLEAALRQEQQRSAPQQGFDLYAQVPEDQRFMSPMERQVQNMAFVQLANAMEQRFNSMENNVKYYAARKASGISESDEAALIQEFPFLNGLAGEQRANAIVQMAKFQQETRKAPQKAVQEAANMLARREAYVESSSGVSSDESVLEPAVEKLLRKARNGEFKSAKESEEALRKAGIQRYDTGGYRY